MTSAIEKAREAARAVLRYFPDVGPDTKWAEVSDDVVNAFLSSLKASGLVIEEGWREIESAPKDGRLCMFWSPRGGMFVAPSVEPPTRDAVRQANLAIHKGSGEWPNAGFNPTHWRPLPAPPAMIAAEGK